MMMSRPFGLRIRLIQTKFSAGLRCAQVTYQNKGVSFHSYLVEVGGFGDKLAAKF